MDNEYFRYITTEGLQKVKDELDYLLSTRRLEIAARLERATESGDLMENSDYQTAKLEQSFVEGRIRKLENCVRFAVIIEEKEPSDHVTIGSTVTLVAEAWQVPETFRIVGETEASPSDGYISNRSPIGSAVLGAQVGEWVVAWTPNGSSRWHVLGIE